MKTWEMIKILTDNPMLKFKTINPHYGSIRVINGVVVWESTLKPFTLNYYGYKINNNSSSFTGGTIEKYEWEIVKDPVDFIIALKAFHEGKTIKCKTKNGCEYIYPYESRCILKDNCGESITSDEILCGTWYIED